MVSRDGKCNTYVFGPGEAPIIVLDVEAFGKKKPEPEHHLPMLCTGNARFQVFALRRRDFLDGSKPGYWIVFFILVLLYTFFYTDVLFSALKYDQNLRHAAASIPGLQHGSASEKYLTAVARRITIPFSLFLGMIAIASHPVITFLKLDISPLLGVSLFIFVGTARDMITTISANLKLEGYINQLLI